nr:MAG TPA: hypothetical protein [Bacteriophage sp.]
MFQCVSWSIGWIVPVCRLVYWGAYSSRWGVSVCRLLIKSITALNSFIFLFVGISQ